MALFYSDSFQNYTSMSDKWEKLFSHGASANIVTNVSGRAQPATMLAQVGGSAAKRFINSYSDAIIGFAMRINNGTGWGAICGLLDVSYDGTYIYTPQILLEINGSNNACRVCRGSTVLATSAAGVWPTNLIWNYIEFKAVIGSSGSVEVKINGITVLTFSGNTQTTGNSYLNGFVLGSISSSDHNDSSATTTYQTWSADLYCLDSSGPGPDNTFLGDTTVYNIQPNSNEGTNQFLPQAASRVPSRVYGVLAVVIDTNGNLQKTTGGGTASSAATISWNTGLGGNTTDGGVIWNNLGTPANYKYIDNLYYNDGQSYLKSSNVGDTELYGFQSITAQNIIAALVEFRSYRDQTTARSLRAVCKSGGTVVDSGADITPLQVTFNADGNTISSGAITFAQGVFRTDPNTGAQWTLDALNGAKFGVKISQ
jgi:hypothetical protein